MKHWMAAAALAAWLGLFLPGCGEKAPEVTWKEASGSVVRNAKRPDGSCVSDIQYETSQGKMTTALLGAGDPLPVGKGVRLKYDEANPGSVKFLDLGEGK